MKPVPPKRSSTGRPRFSGGGSPQNAIRAGRMSSSQPGVVRQLSKSASQPLSPPGSGRLSKAADLGSSLETTLRALFAAYDKDGSGHIDIEEYVEAQTILASAQKVALDKHTVVSDFFDLSMTGAVGYIEFSQWQCNLLASTKDTQEEMEAHVAWCLEQFTVARDSPKSQAAGTGTSAARQLMSKSGKASVGHASAKRGFVEDTSSVNADLDAFDRFVKSMGDSCDDEDRKLQIARLARELRELRRKRRAASTAKEAQTLRQEEKSKGSALRDLWRKRQQERHGKLTLQGNVNCKGNPIDGASLELSLESTRLASTTSDRAGAFELRTEAHLGQGMSLVAEKESFAKAIKRVGGDGVRQLRIEMLPLTVKERFKAKPGSKESRVFKDRGSATKFEVPVGEITKDGEPFAGDVVFQAAVVDLSTPSGIESMPPLVGRSANGALSAMNSLGCVYVDMRDPTDGTGLGLQPESSGIDVSLPSNAPLPPNPPSVWHYNDMTGEWEQTFQALAVNGSEIPAPNADDSPEIMELEEDKLAEQQVAAEQELQQGRQKLNEQRQQAQEPKICTCGFEAKQAIMPLVCKSVELSQADPPKRVFASTKMSASGELCLAFPYLTDDDKTVGAEKASQVPEVILSHHLSKAKAVLGEPWVQERPTHEVASSMKASTFYDSDAKEALASLQYIADWMLDAATATDADTGELEEDVDPTFLHLKVLEKLAGLWARADYDPSVRCAGPTLHELREALEDFSGDIAAALLQVARDQTRRSEVARVRQILQRHDPRMTAKFRIVDQALDEARGDVDVAADAVMKDPTVNKYLTKLKTREELYNKLPMAHPTSKQLEQAMDQAGGDPEKAAAILDEMPAVHEKAKEVYKTYKETLEEANETNNFNFQVQDPGYTNVDAEWTPPPYTPSHKPSPTLEFFRPAPRPLCPVGDSSMVLGAFDDGIFAARATSVGITYKGVDYAEEVQPDGTFSLIALGRTEFEVTTTKKDGTPSFGFGPFTAERGGQVTHLGLLSPPREDADVANELSASKIDVVLPALEFPPHCDPASGEWSQWLGTWQWTSDRSLSLLDEERIPIKADGFTLERSPNKACIRMHMKGQQLICEEGADNTWKETTITGEGRAHSGEVGEYLSIDLSENPDYEGQRIELFMCLEEGEEDLFTGPDNLMTDYIKSNTDETRSRWLKVRTTRIGSPGVERCTCFDQDECGGEEEGEYEGEYDEY